MSDAQWRDEFLGVLAHLEIHAEQRDAALAALRTTIAGNTPIDDLLVPLKVAAGRTQFSAETIRLWALKRLIKSERRGGRWFVNPRSLAERIRRRSLPAL
jgi:hypothetical protein